MDKEQVRAQNTAELFHAVGAVVVAGGHVEWRLKRLLLWLHGKGPSDLPDVTSLTWTTLTERIRSAALSSSRGVEVLALLGQADDQNLKFIRDNAVHTYWWTNGGPGLYGNRHPSKKGSSGFIVVGQVEDLHRGANLLFEFASELAALTPDDGWPVVVAVGD